MVSWKAENNSTLYQETDSTNREIHFVAQSGGIECPFTLTPWGLHHKTSQNKSATPLSIQYQNEVWLRQIGKDGRREGIGREGKEERAGDMEGGAAGSSSSLCYFYSSRVVTFSSSHYLPSCRYSIIMYTYARRRVCVYAVGMALGLYIDSGV